MHLPPWHDISSPPHNYSFFNAYSTKVHKIFFVSSPYVFWYMLCCTWTFLQAVCHLQICWQDAGRPIKLPKIGMEFSEPQPHNWEKQLQAGALGIFFLFHLLNASSTVVLFHCKVFLTMESPQPKKKGDSEFNHPRFLTWATGVKHLTILSREKMVSKYLYYGGLNVYFWSWGGISYISFSICFPTPFCSFITVTYATEQPNFILPDESYHWLWQKSNVL